MNVFVDTNVLLDVLTHRESFYADSAAIWTLAEQGRIRGYVSVISFTNIFYIVRKLRNRKIAHQTMLLLRDSFTPVACDDQIIAQAVDADVEDFEDAVQYFSALRVGADCLVSRNPHHFSESDLPVLKPVEFLAAHSFK